MIKTYVEVRKIFIEKYERTLDILDTLLHGVGMTNRKWGKLDNAMAERYAEDYGYLINGREPVSMPSVTDY